MRYLILTLIFLFSIQAVPVYADTVVRGNRECEMCIPCRGTGTYIGWYTDSNGHNNRYKTKCKACGGFGYDINSCKPKKEKRKSKTKIQKTRDIAVRQGVIEVSKFGAKRTLLYSANLAPVPGVQQACWVATAVDALWMVCSISYEGWNQPKENSFSKLVKPVVIKKSFLFF